MCLIGNEALSADHKNQKENKSDDWRICYFGEDGFPNKL